MRRKSCEGSYQSMGERESEKSQDMSLLLHNRGDGPNIGWEPLMAGRFHPFKASSNQLLTSSKALETPPASTDPDPTPTPTPTPTPIPSPLCPPPIPTCLLIKINCFLASTSLCNILRSKSISSFSLFKVSIVESKACFSICFAVDGLAISDSGEADDKESSLWEMRL